MAVLGLRSLAIFSVLFICNDFMIGDKRNENQRWVNGVFIGWSYDGSIGCNIEDFKMRGWFILAILGYGNSLIGIATNHLMFAAVTAWIGFGSLCIGLWRRRQKK